MNDGACDPQGRFWGGTMAYDEAPGAGSLYRLELDGTCTTVLTGLTISNGIGWSPDANTMYLNDSGTGCTEMFRFEGPSGAIGERRTLVHIDSRVSCPTGSPSAKRVGSGWPCGAVRPSTGMGPTGRS
jgi:sugar lactone lactonase YvrE